MSGRFLGHNRLGEYFSQVQPAIYCDLLVFLLNELEVYSTYSPKTMGDSDGHGDGGGDGHGGPHHPYPNST